MKSDVLLLPGTTTMQFDNQAWLYNDRSFRDYHHNDMEVSDSITDYKFVPDEISFEHFVPPTDQIVSTPSPAASADMSVSHNDGSRSGSRIERSRKSRSSKQSPASEEDTPENKSRRRREQNRIAQRTFRERKDRYIQNLESHIKMLDASHKDLQASYKQSTDQVSALYTQLIEAQGELDYWRCLAQSPATPAAGSSSSYVTPSPMIMHVPTPTRMNPTASHDSMHSSIAPTHPATVMPGLHMPHGHYTQS